MYRDVIIGAIRDLGLGDAVTVSEVVRWRATDGFTCCCEIANWDEGWIKDLMRSIDALPFSVKKPITRKSIEMMRAVARMTTGSTNIPLNERLESPAGPPSSLTRARVGAEIMKEGTRT